MIQCSGCNWNSPLTLLPGKQHFKIILKIAVITSITTNRETGMRFMLLSKKKKKKSNT